MTGKELFQEIGMIKEEYIAEAESCKRSIIHNAVFKRTLATAACLVVCMGIYWGTQWSMDVEDLKAENSVKQMEDVSDEACQMEQEGVPEVLTDEESGSSKDGIVECLPKENAANVSGTEKEEIPLQEIKEAAQKETVIQNQPEQESVSSGMQESMDIMDGTVMDFTKVKARLAEYPEDFDQLCQQEAYIIIHGSVEKGQEKWDSFLAQVKALESAAIDIIQFTIEGEPIITYLYFDGQEFYVVRDNTRDAYAGSGAGVSECTYPYLNILQEDEQIEVILSKEANLTTEQLQSGEYEAYSLFQRVVEQ